MTKKLKKRRSDLKKMTKEATTLKFMRESQSLSMRKAAKLIGVSEATINHSENGRRDLSPDFILSVVTSYGYCYQNFIEFLEGKKEVPEHLLSECIAIIKRLDKSKLRSVKAILESF
jgi:transcriptional regulator with XRE-family HTH domain